jgi:Tol biopolymer transport system component
MADGSLRKRFAVPGTVAGLTWAPKGDGLVYVRGQVEGENLWFQPIEGGSPRQLTNFKTESLTAYAWAPDGMSVVCSRGSFLSDVYLVKVEPPGVSVPEETVR